VSRNCTLSQREGSVRESDRRRCGQGPQSASGLRQTVPAPCRAERRSRGCGRVRREHSQPHRLKQEQGARLLLPGARLESWRRVQHDRVQVVHEARQAVYAVLRLHRVVWEPAQRASPAGSEIAARAKRHGAGGDRGHVGRHGPRAVQRAPLHPHEILPPGIHAAR
jgi:hypothetical protein